MAGHDMPTMNSSTTTVTMSTRAIGLASLGRRTAAALCLVAATAGLGLTGCRNEMYNQEKAEPFEMNTVFADSQASRPIIEGTVPRSGRIAGVPDAIIRDSAATVQWGMADAGALNAPAQPATGDSAAAPTATDGGTAVPGARPKITAAQLKVASIPFPVTREVLDRGHERYNIFCSPCHGQTGDGNGMIVQRGFPQPPSLHLERLRTAPDGHYYDVITNGFGMMYSYAARVKPTDRWAIAAYIRALQLSRNADAPVRPALGAVDTSR